MKKFKRILALVIATAMVLTMMSMTAFAADSTTYKITITAPAGHTYEVFQVFTGTPAGSGDQLNSLKYGKNAKTGTEGQAVSQADMTSLQTIAEGKPYANDQAAIAVLEPFVDFNSTPIKEISSGTASEALAPGYYVIRDKDGTEPADEGETLYMFMVLNADLSTSAKSGVPESDKSVETEGTNAGDYSIGDTITYYLTFTLPDDYANFKKYYVQFNDKMDAGLTYNGDAKIFYGDDSTGDSIDMGADAQTACATLTYTINDLKTFNTETQALEAGDVITIEYTAYLNEHAEIGKTGNKNEYTVKFSRNPNEGGSGTPETGETPKDTTIVFSYKTIFDKIDEDGNALQGADFLLEKEVSPGVWKDVTTLNTSASPAKMGSSAESSTTFSFSGLDAGNYRLTESYTPAGYNTMAPVEFTIDAELKITLGTSDALESLSSTGLVMSADLAAGSLQTSIENQSGAELPETGGIGTTIFYVVGAILVIGAGVVLITRRRMSA